ncbi:MAG: hypothetical protein JSS87_11520 [Acidobacteria bacterium]|nr:hypothetical protein [Acidobacteriota bacterium]
MATDVVNFDLGFEATEATSKVADPTEVIRRRSRLYSVLVVLLPLIAIPVFIALGQSDFFLHHGASIWVQSNDAVFQMRNRNCEVLIFGDSTAMTGIDPALVEKDTGYKTCNIAVTNAVLSVTDNMTLDHFLAHNTRPRVLVVQLSPDGFQKENHSWNRSIYAEGMLELMRHGTPEETRRMLLQHPHEAVSFAGYAAGFSAYYGLKQAFYFATRMRPDEDEVRVRNGFFTPPVPARTRCDAVPTTPASADNTYPHQVVQDYHRNYIAHSDVVLVNVAPIPSCDKNLQQYQKNLAGVTNNTLTPLPIAYFNDGRHYTASGSEVVSRLVSDEVNRVAGLTTEEAQQRRGAQIVAALQSSAPITR